MMKAEITRLEGLEYELMLQANEGLYAQAIIDTEMYELAKIKIVNREI